MNPKETHKICKKCKHYEPAPFLSLFTSRFDTCEHPHTHPAFTDLITGKELSRRCYIERDDRWLSVGACGTDAKYYEEN